MSLRPHFLQITPKNVAFKLWLLAWSFAAGFFHLSLSHIAVIAVIDATLLSPSPLPLPPHKLLPLQPPPLPPPLPPLPLRRLLALPSPVGCCILANLGFRSIRLFTMSQSRFLQEEISKKYRQAANNAAINAAITDLVAARNVRHADGGKRLIKSSNLYKNVIASMQSAGVNITYDEKSVKGIGRRHHYRD